MNPSATNVEEQAEEPESGNIEQQIPEQWNHVAGLKPQLHKHVSVHPHDFRGSRWYILTDSARGKHLRFNDLAYEFIGRLDGDATVDEIYNQIEINTNNNGPSRQDLLSILIQLFSVGALRSGLPADVEQLFTKQQNEKSANRTRRWLNPLAIRFPLFDPDRFLNRSITSVRPAISVTGAVLWSLVILIAAMLLVVNYQELASTLKANILAPRNLILIVALFPIMKAIHEFAHAYAVKAWGGEVHEMGITVLVLMPVPYVDATAAWAFREKYKRILVSASGMIAELFLAAIAFIIWTLVAPGIIKDAALSAFLIGSVSTVLFNANPLLRFDGYYILQDAIEIPNLYSRSSNYTMYLLKRYVLGMTEAESPATDSSERGWLASYGILAWLYRVFITFVIAIFLASKYFVLGIALAIWSMVLLFVLPTYRGIRFLLIDKSLSGSRTHTIGRAAALAACIAVVVSFIPFSLYTNAEGVVWVPDQAQIFADVDGFVTEVSTRPGDHVASGSSVMRLENPSIDAREKVLQAKYKELGVRHKSEKFDDPAQATQTLEEITMVEADWAQLQTERTSQTLTSATSGTFVVPDQRSLVGRYVKKGEAVGYVVNPEELIVRVVVPQTSVGLFAKEVKNVSVRLAEETGKELPANIVRQTPAGSLSLPSRALGAAGGGEIAVNSTDENGTTAVNKVFQLDLALPENSITSGLGTRAYVRVNHGREALALQWLRSAKQLLLNKLPF